MSDLSRQTQGKETQGDYRPLQDIEATKQRLKENISINAVEMITTSNSSVFINSN